MKYKLLSVNNGEVQNIGDFVQALASSQFIPNIDGFINREELSSYNGDECKIIMNGWFMHQPGNWPPSDKIKPLFIAFHLNVSVAEKLLSSSGIEYFKKHEPIGCRDYNTVKLLESKGIKAYFSGCLTLTLGLKYKSDIKSGDVFVVDPIIPNTKNPKVLFSDIMTLVKRLPAMFSLNKKLRPSKNIIKGLFLTSRFFRIYSEWFDSKSLEGAIYIKQESRDYTRCFDSDFKRLEEAERLVKLYAKAAFVITSRIHCALPCVGLGTPVYYLKKSNDDIISSCRFDGLIDLFNVFDCDDYSINPCFELNEKISKQKVVENKEFPQGLIDSLKNKCKVFVES